MDFEEAEESENGGFFGAGGGDDNRGMRDRIKGKIDVKAFSSILTFLG